MPLELSDKRLAVLGTGKLGGILLRAYLKQDLFSPKRVTATVKHAEKASALAKELGVSVSTENRNAVRGADIVQLINEIYEANTARERWQAGDLMLVDNVRTAHAREPFEGPREVLVAMADGVRLANSSPTIKTTGG